MRESDAIEIKASTVLPARRENIVLRTADGLDLVGELALPLSRDPVATLICLHPLPTAGGMMDSHLFRKASYRLPALADLAVLSKDYMTAPVEQVGGIESLLTMVGGKIVYAAAPYAQFENNH